MAKVLQTIAILAAVALAHAATLTTSARMAVCSPCKTHAQCASEFCHPQTYQCQTSPNYVDIAHDDCPPRGPKPSSPPPPPPARTPVVVVPAPTVPTVPMPSPGVDVLCSACNLGTDCQAAVMDTMAHDLRCVNGLCLTSLEPAIVAQCFPTGVMQGRGKKRVCDDCDSGAHCRSGVCVNNRCRADASYAALQTAC